MEFKISLYAGSVYPYYMAEDIIPVLEEVLENNQKKVQDPEATEAVVLFSGDSGFYSGSEKLYQRLQEWKKGKTGEILIQIFAGISSVSYFAAACGVNWQDAKIMSIHGRGEQKEWESKVLFAIRYHAKVFLLVSGAEDVRSVGAILYENGFTDCKIILGYQLSYPEEKIVECTPKQCKQTKEEGLYILAVFYEACEKRYLAPQKRDEEFIRGKVPMTKEETRELAVCKLKLTKEAVVYDIGSGTGSVAVEIAEQSEMIRVYAVEQKEEGAELIRQNQKKFRLPNIEIINKKAPDCLAELPIPTHAFVGGSGGRLGDIMKVLYQKNSTMRIVITAVSLETLGEITEMISSMPVENEEIIQIQVSRTKKTGNYHFMQAENPIWICSFNFVEAGVVVREDFIK